MVFNIQNFKVTDVDMLVIWCLIYRTLTCRPAGCVVLSLENFGEKDIDHLVM